MSELQSALDRITNLQAKYKNAHEQIKSIGRERDKAHERIHVLEKEIELYQEIIIESLTADERE